MRMGPVLVCFLQGRLLCPGESQPHSLPALRSPSLCSGTVPAQDLQTPFSKSNQATLDINDFIYCEERLNAR